MFLLDSMFVFLHCTVPIYFVCIWTISMKFHKSIVFLSCNACNVSILSLHFFLSFFCSYFIFYNSCWFGENVCGDFIWCSVMHSDVMFYLMAQQNNATNSNNNNTNVRVNKKKYINTKYKCAMRHVLQKLSPSFHYCLLHRQTDRDTDLHMHP